MDRYVRDYFEVVKQTPGGLATLTLTEGRTSIMHEGARRRQVVTLNPSVADLGGFVARLRAAIAQRVKLPPTVYLEFAGAASGETATVHTRFPVRLAVTVTDAHGNAVPGVRVTFLSPGHGASARFGKTHSHRVTVKTDAHGVAVAPSLVANGKPGGYAVTVSAGGRSTAFALVNLPKA